MYVIIMNDGQYSVVNELVADDMCELSLSETTILSVSEDDVLLLDEKDKTFKSIAIPYRSWET